MMDRRAFIIGSAAALATPLVAQAQRAKVYRIACLWASPAAMVEPYQRALLTGLEERGLIEGHSVTFDHRYLDSPAAIPRFAAELLAKRPDVLVAVSNPVIEVAKRATSSVPIVMLYAADPVGSGFVRSVAKPGTNVTGLAFDPDPSLFAKNVELLKEAVPHAGRIGMLWNPQFYTANAATKAYIDGVSTLAGRLALSIRSLPATGMAEIERIFHRFASDRIDALQVVPDAFVTFQYFPAIAQMCLSQRLPSIYAFREYVQAGGLLSYGPSIIEQPRYAAGHIERLLRGASAADMPVEQPSRFELAVNAKTAKALGLTIPQSLLLRADQVME